MTIVASAAFLLPSSRVLWWGWGIMKNIDIKSIIIGALLTSTIFLGVAATGVDDKWDKNQAWGVMDYEDLKGKGLARWSGSADAFESSGGWEPFFREGGKIWYRRRYK